MNGSFGGGIGTAEDPYLIEDVYDFCKLRTTQYYKLVKDIDFNDHDVLKNGFNQSICTNGAHLDGNHKKVRNIVVTSGTSNIMYLNAHDVDFENIFVIDCPTGSNSVFNGIFVNCRAYIRLINSNINYAVRGTYEKCTLTLTGDSTSGLLLPTLSESRIHLKNLIITTSLLKSSDVMFGSFITITNMKKSYITGDITPKGMSSGYKYNDEYIIYPLDYSTSYKVDLSYFAFKVNIADKGKLGDSVCKSSISCLNGSFFDYELMGYESKPDGKGLVALTTAESKDVDILNANGFLCIKV